MLFQLLSCEMQYTYLYFLIYSLCLNSISISVHNNLYLMLINGCYLLLFKVKQNYQFDKMTINA